MDEVRDVVFDRLLYADLQTLRNPEVDEEYEIIDDYFFDLKEVIPHLEDWSVGVSKLVLSFDDIDDFVVKIPFRTLCVYRNNDSVSDDVTLSKDYCFEEAKKYQLAIKAGVQDMMCGTWFVGRVGTQECPVYLSERALEDYYTDGQEEAYSDPSEEGMALARSISNSSNMEYDLANYMVAEFVDSYGGAMTERLVKFVNDNKVFDLHDGNVMRLNGKVRLVDYSSFDEDLW